MKQKNSLRLFLPLVLLVSAALACGPVSTNTAATQTMDALATIVEASLGSEEATEGPEATSPPEATEPPAEPTEEAPPTPTVAHEIQPSSPGGVKSFMTDRSSASLASERRANADTFDINLLERPFTTEVMDYQDYLDLIRAELSMGPPWVYVNIFLEGPPPADSDAAYGVEIDLDVDGHGDWLILATAPPDSTWTTDGVRACRDANGDVGGPTPMISDSPNAARDGYEDCVFDSGYGIGPDEAWIRRDPGNADRIQIAFLYTLIGNDGEFMWGAWSDENIHDPAWFDYHDHFTLIEAGSPATESSQYPVKAMASLDNTCRWAYGFTPTGSEPGVCYIPPTPTPELPGSISGTVWRDFDLDGTRDSGDGGIAGKTVTLRSGNCSGAVIATTMTNRSGAYTFLGVPVGDYCISVEHSCGACSGECPSTAHPRTTTVDSGEDVVGIDFGLYLVGPC
jgi:hypothetical protein